MIRTFRALLAAALFFNVAFASQPALAAAIAPAPHPTESFDSGMLHVDRYGSGPKTLVFIPGLASGTWTWYEQIAHFSPNYTIYAITLPGFDGRAASNESDLLAGFTRDFWSLLEQRHIDKPVVIGHSLGGTLAILLAEQHPDRLAGIVAADGLPVFPAAAQSTADQRASMAKGITTQLDSMQHASFVQYERNYMATIGTTDAAFAPSLGDLVSKSDPKAVGAWAAADLTTDLRPQLAKVTIPFEEIMPYASPSPYSESDTLTFYKMLVAGAPKAQVVADYRGATLRDAGPAAKVRRNAHAVSRAVIRPS